MIDRVAVRFVMTAALFFCCFAASAQSSGKGHELRLGYGGAPVGLGLADGFFYQHEVDPWIYHSRDRFRDYRGNARSYGTLTLEYWWNFGPKRAIGLNVGFDKLFGDVYDGLTDTVKGRQQSYGIAIYPEYRRIWNPGSKVKVYLAASAGFGVGCYNNCKKEYRPGEWSYVPILQFNPVGLSFGGRNVFGFAQLEIGTYLFGGRAGIGYKF